MDREGIRRVAEAMDADITSAPLSAKWLNISCPFAPWEHKNAVDSNPSFGVQINKSGISRMHCFACGKGGELFEVLHQLKFLKADIDYKTLNEIALAESDGAELPSLDDDEDDEHTGLFQFPETWLDSFPKAVNNGIAMMYLAGRKGGPVPASIAAMLDLRWDPFNKRVCFPIRGDDGHLYGLHGRAVEADNPLRYMAYGYKKRRNPHVWLGEDTVDWNKPVVAAESVFDLARVKQVYRNVISPLHGDISAYQLERIKPAFELISVFDADKTGSIGRNKLTKWGGKQRIIRHVALEDGTDGGMTPVEELAKELSQFVKLDPMIL